MLKTYIVQMMEENKLEENLRETIADSNAFYKLFVNAFVSCEIVYAASIATDVIKHCYFFLFIEFLFMLCYHLLDFAIDALLVDSYVRLFLIYFILQRQKKGI